MTASHTDKKQAETIMIGTDKTKIPCLIFDHAEALARWTADEILDDIEAAERTPYLLGCPAGRTPMATYRAMGARAHERGCDLSGLVIVMMDEYLANESGAMKWCPPDVHYSCHKAAREDIQGAINLRLPEAHRIPDDHVWFPDPSDPAGYDRRIAASGGIGLFLLASGASDGHVAFNPPGSPLDSVTRIIESKESTRRDNLATFPLFKSIDEVPRMGVGVGLGTIASHSRRVILQIHGEDKRQAFQRLATLDGFNAEWPASFIYQCSQPLVVADRAAYGKE